MTSALTTVPSLQSYALGFFSSVCEWHETGSKKGTVSERGKSWSFPAIPEFGALGSSGASSVSWCHHDFVYVKIDSSDPLS